MNIIEQLGLVEGQYELTWNPGGPAVSGDINLITPFFLGLSTNKPHSYFPFPKF